VPLLLAGLSGFVIVEITDPRSTPLEMMAISTSYAVPILPVMAQQQVEFGCLQGSRSFPGSVRAQIRSAKPADPYNRCWIK
jgi:hypothetical protein